MRYLLEIAYNGTNYCGWQKQKNAISVQQTLEKHLETLCGETTQTMGCGRTDTGVHARKYFLHFDSVEICDLAMFVQNLNGLLPCDIVSHNLQRVTDNFNARYDARTRQYRYFMHRKSSPFLNKLSYFYSRNLDIETMNKACVLLMNYTDFSCFRKTRSSNKTNTCHVTKARWYKREDKLVFIVGADRFLRNMVRAMVGTLIWVGENRIDLKEFEEILQSKNRQEAGVSVPACGLYLWDVGY
jgi:tRNA pseudouridine38-40 synthase